jgi:two-component system, LytTR family, sensor kinase
MEINVDASKLNYLVPPLAVQTMLENAFKHNKAATESPLFIKIYNESDWLVIVNNLQPKIKPLIQKALD